MTKSQKKKPLTHPSIHFALVPQRMWAKKNLSGCIRAITTNQKSHASCSDGKELIMAFKHAPRKPKKKLGMRRAIIMFLRPFDSCTSPARSVNAVAI